MAKTRKNKGPVIDAKFEDIQDQNPGESTETQQQDAQQPDQPDVGIDSVKDPWYKSAPKAVWGFAKKNKKKIVAGAAIVGGVIGALFTLEKVAESRGYADDSTDGDTEEYLPESEDEGGSDDSSESTEPDSQEAVTE